MVDALEATTEEFTLKKDRRFTFAMDRLDTGETEGQLQAAKALARQNQEGEKAAGQLCSYDAL